MTRMLSAVPWALLLLVGAMKADVANAACIAADKKGNYSATEHVRCLRKEAQQGALISQYVLGLFYYNGDGIPQDYEEAAKWFRQAADRGYDMPQYFLGKLYASGRGVPKNIVVSHMWFNLSAAQGNEYAKDARDRLEQHMTSAQIAEAQKLVREWKPKPER
jgi:TPR repeat protein